MLTRKRNGYSLIELLIVLAVIGLIAGIALPNFHKMRNRVALRAAAGELRSVFHHVRMRALCCRSVVSNVFLTIASPVASLTLT